ncbi:MAG TPA: methionyl-tRNA formyltransferase [Verrucomicrobiae bacterium]|nr:methionyl-tRNA formyltransferase [Verrucomicrobiae bacterium]
MGSAELACPGLRALVSNSQFKVIAVVTQPDRPKGRDLKLSPSPVKSCALELGLPVLQPERARDEVFIQELRQLAPDLIVVIAYGQILPRAILELPRYGCLNVHTSLLPKYRGAAPIQWAILNDEEETGVTIMKMDEGLDTGDIVAVAKTPIATDDNASTLHDRLGQMGGELLVRTIPDYAAGKITAHKQPVEGASYARKIKKEDGRIDWNRPARRIWNTVRAFVPWPVAFTYFREKDKTQVLKVWSAVEEPVLKGAPGAVLQADKAGVVVACGEGALRILSLQREGGKRLSAQEFIAGHQLKNLFHLPPS